MPSFAHIEILGHVGREPEQKYRKPMVSRVCGTCAVTFLAVRWDALHGKGLYCSKRCAVKQGGREKRFWTHVDKSGECWLWTGAIDKDGYGTFFDDGKRLRAHRVAWGFTHGPLPDDRCVLHTCDVRHCMRDAHHFEGDRPANTADMISKGRARIVGEQNAMAKLTEQTVIELRASYAAGEASTYQLAQKYRVCRASISKIINRHSWRHVA